MVKFERDLFYMGRNVLALVCAMLFPLCSQGEVTLSGYVGGRLVTEVKTFADQSQAVSYLLGSGFAASHMVEQGSWGDIARYAVPYASVRFAGQYQRTGYSVFGCDNDDVPASSAEEAIHDHFCRGSSKCNIHIGAWTPSFVSGRTVRKYAHYNVNGYSEIVCQVKHYNCPPIPAPGLDSFFNLSFEYGVISTSGECGIPPGMKLSAKIVPVDGGTSDIALNGGSCSLGGDPVDLITGQVNEHVVDSVINLPGFNNVVIERYYSNKGGWQFSYTDHLGKGKVSGERVLYLSNGLVFGFKDGRAVNGFKGSVENGRYVMSDGTKLGFNGSTGRLTQVDDRTGNALGIGYDANGNINSLEDSLGHSITISSHDGKFDSVTDPMGNTINYQYDNTGNLTEVDYPTGAKVYYQYTDSAHPTYLTAILDTNHKVVSSWTYNSDGQAISNTVVQ